MDQLSAAVKINIALTLWPSDLLFNSTLENYSRLYQLPPNLSNFFAQTEALMTGKDPSKVRAEMKTVDEVIVPHKVFIGNLPTNSIMYHKMIPHSLGGLAAMYEHRPLTGCCVGDQFVWLVGCWAWQAVGDSYIERASGWWRRTWSNYWGID